MPMSHCPARFDSGAPLRPPTASIVLIIFGARESLRAGTSPKSSAVNTVRPSANARTVALISTGELAGSASGTSATSESSDSVREQHASDRARQRQDHALGQQLPDQSPSSRADRRADRQLHVPGRAPRQHETRNVDARDDQDEAHRHRQRVDRGAELAGLVVVHRLDARHGPERSSVHSAAAGVTASNAALACASVTPGRSRAITGVPDHGDRA